MTIVRASASRSSAIELWQRQFSGDPALVGRTMLLNREPYEVIGVMPPGFAFPIKGSVDGVDAAPTSSSRWRSRRRN